MSNSDIDPAMLAGLVSLQAQRVALVAVLEMHVRRSEELSVQVVLLDEEIERVAQAAKP